MEYLYCAVDCDGDSVDFLFTAKQDLAAARWFLERTIKRITRPMLVIKPLWSARVIIAGIKIMHIIRKEQLGWPAAVNLQADAQQVMVFGMRAAQGVPGVTEHDAGRADKSASQLLHGLRFTMFGIFKRGAMA